MALQYPLVSLTESVTTAGVPSTLQKTVALVSFGATQLSSGTRQLVTNNTFTAFQSKLTSGSWLLPALTTLFAQGSTSVYVLELGTPGTVTQATGTATVTNGVITAAEVTEPGGGYTVTPKVTVTGSGTGAIITASLSNGEVSGLTIQDGGTGYTDGATLTINAPTSPRVDLLSAYLEANLLRNYLYVLGPVDSLDNDLESLIANYDGYTSYTYFLLTLPASRATAFGSHKACILFIPSDSAPDTEMGTTSVAYMFSSISPSATAPIKPFNLRYVTGVTEYAQPGDAALQDLVGTNVNVVIPATAGGIDKNMLLGGQCSDGNAIGLWYGADYASLNVTQDLNNELIVGSNDDASPLKYNQLGISRLLARAQQSLTNAVSVGAILGPITVSAVGFADYVAANPSAYEEGIYDGISFTITPARGFAAISYVMTVDFTAQTVTATAQ